MGDINVLIVDDDPKAMFALEELLSSPSRRLVKARSGDEALKRLLETPDFAVILLDIQLGSGMDGFETASMIRARQCSAGTPIIFMTAYDKGELDVLKGYGLGGVDYVFKPIIPKILKAKVDVFVSLYERSEEVIRQADIIRRQEIAQHEEERRRRELESALVSMREIADGRHAQKREHLERTQSMKDVQPQAFAAVKARYGKLIELYLDAKALRTRLPHQEASEVAAEIGAVSGGPQDVVEVHLQTLTRKSKEENPKRVEAYTREGRLLVLEVMGHLVDYYRFPVAPGDIGAKQEEQK